MRDDRARAHNGVFTNLDTSLNHTVVANVDIFPNVHLLGNLGSVAALQRLVVGWRLECLYCHSDSNLGVPPNADPRRIMEVAVGTNDYIVGNVQMVAVVAGKRSSNVNITAQVANDIVGVLSGRDPSSCKYRLEKALSSLL